MDNLLEAINDFYHQNGHYPKVKVSPKFYDKHYWDIPITVFYTMDITETVDQWELE